MSNIYAALEIGTSRTVLAVGESENGGRLKVVCHAEIPSCGIRKSQILDMNQAVQSVKGVLNDISKKDKDLSIADALLVISGQHVIAETNQGVATIETGCVTAEDMREADENARERQPGKDRELLDIVEQDYTVDDRGVLSPKGLAGHVLKLNTLHIHADAKQIQNARSAAETAKLEISEPVFAATCAAEAVLDDNDKKNGVLVLDLGGGSTGYAAYCDGYLVDTGVIGVGGDHVTNDIAHAFQLQNGQSEKIKLEEASAILTPEGEGNPRVTVPNSFQGSQTISRRALETVVNARLRELCEVIADRIEERGLSQRLHAGIVLTGGGAAMRDLDELFRREFALPVRIGRPIHVDGFDTESRPESFAAIAGALLYAHRSGGDDQGGGILGKLGSIFK